MKRVSIKDLKSGLSAAIATATEGGVVMITRHNKPVAQLIAPGSPAVRRGHLVGRGALKPALKRGTGGRYLRVLLDDRGGR